MNAAAGLGLGSMLRDRLGSQRAASAERFAKSTGAPGSSAFGYGSTREELAKLYKDRTNSLSVAEIGAFCERAFLDNGYSRQIAKAWAASVVSQIEEHYFSKARVAMAGCTQADIASAALLDLEDATHLLRIRFHPPLPPTKSVEKPVVKTIAVKRGADGSLTGTITTN